MPESSRKLTRDDLIVHKIATGIHHWLMKKEGAEDFRKTSKHPINQYANGIDRVCDIGRVVREQLKEANELADETGCGAAR